MRKNGRWMTRFALLGSILLFCGCIKTVSGQYYNLRADRLYENDRKQEAFELYQQSAQNGNAESQYVVAQMLLFGDGVSRNDAEGMRWLELSARQDHPEAARDMGIYLLNGEFKSPANASQGVQFLSQAAAKKDSFSMLILGYLHTTGYGVERDPEKAASWYRLAAEHGEPLPEGLLDARMLAQSTPVKFNFKADQLARVKRAQACLKALGYYKGGVDGLAGPGTAAAIRKFQKDRNTEINGRVDAVLMRHLYGHIFIDPINRRL